jgi:hypothetical protein
MAATRSDGRVSAGTRPHLRWQALALPVAAAWSFVYVVLGIAWLAGAGGNPADPSVDDASGLSLLTVVGETTGAAVLTAAGGVGLLLTATMVARRRHLRIPLLPPRTTTVLAVGLALALAVLLPDFRLIAAIAYAPILLVLGLFGGTPGEVTLWPWPVVNMAVLALAGLAWFVAAVDDAGRRGSAAAEAGRERTGNMSGHAARWGARATGLAVALPLGYAVTRYAWALGIPLGVSRQFLDELGTAAYAGAGLATLAVVGAILTLGLVQRWGEVFPRWLVGLRGRSVPVALAVVPAAVASVVVTSAGLMFVRFGITGRFAESFPGETSDVAAWLPEMFWPLWGAALAAATYAYWLRRQADRTAGPP